MNTEIIYEDRDIIVVRKPAGLATQTAKVGQQDVVSELKNYLRQPYLGIIHRLDQPVEGLLVFAKNRSAAAGLTAQLQRQGEGGVLHKRYYAALCGKPSENQGRLVDYLYKDESNRAVVVQGIGEPGAMRAAKDIGEPGAMEAAKDIGEPGAMEAAKGIGVSAKEAARRDAALAGAKRAALSYRILQTIDAPAELALAEICLETGRFHQIRAQLSYHGYPLLGDVKYGDDRVKSLSRGLGVKNVALCAFYLEFVHPVTQKSMNIQIKPQGQGFSPFACFDLH